jgi:hypothetical protein
MAIKVRVGGSGQVILAVQATYLVGALIVEAPEHASSQMLTDGHEGTPHTLRLGQNELLTGISGSVGQQLNQINFRTSLGRQVGFGSPDGTKFSVQAPSNAAVFALFGGISEFGLSSVGAHFALPQHSGWFVTGADCVVSSWDSCSPCTKSCGGGNKVCTRKVIIPAFAGGIACPALVENFACRTEPCPKDCQISVWSEFSQPPQSCLLHSLRVQGFAVEVTRTRTILHGPTRGGISCPALIQHRVQTLIPCPKCSNTTSWECGPCSATCGQGTKVCHASTGLGSQDGCPTSSSQKCEMPACSQDCVLSGWEQWSACSGCVNGTRQRRRSVVMMVSGCHHPRLVQHKACTTSCKAKPCRVSR